MRPLCSTALAGGGHIGSKSWIWLAELLKITSELWPSDTAGNGQEPNITCQGDMEDITATSTQCLHYTTLYNTGLHNYVLYYTVL